jgi:hypothetical protein
VKAGPDPARAALDARVLAWMHEPASPEHWPANDARFDALALELFAFQFERCAPFRRFCEGRGRTPHSVGSWREIPPVPTGAFKEMALRSFPEERRIHVFRTSGTSTELRGQLELDTLALYEASLVPTFRVHVLPDLAFGGRVQLRVLTPSAGELPDSSLSHMFATLLPLLGTAESGFDVRSGRVDYDALLARLRGSTERGEAVALCGTAFAFVHLLDELAHRSDRVSLPPGSRVMETGGFKGRSRVMARGELYAAIAESLAIPPARIVNQYGMTELGSQFYDTVLRQPGAPRRKLGPPWARVRLVDPTTGEDAAEGEVGMIVIVDLANTGSVLALETADLGRRIGDGFEVLGRAAGAEARGCSIAADEMLARDGA